MTREELRDYVDEQRTLDNIPYHVYSALIDGIDTLEQEPRWIPVSEKLPKDLEPVNITWVNHKPAPYYNDIKDKPFTAMGVYFNGQWYWWSKTCTDILAEYSHNYADIIDDAIEVEAWMPCYDDIMDDDIDVLAWMALPESYKAESEK